MNEIGPIWSPDGNRILYSSVSNGKADLYQKLATGSGSDELIFKSDQDKLAGEWSSDGRNILFRSADPKTGFDIWVLPLTGDRKPTRFLQMPFNETGPHFSPDGKWIAYYSNESGPQQVYVQPFPPTGDKWQVSVEGGQQPEWRRDGKELFFISLDNRLMSVDVEWTPKFRAGVPKPLFEIPGYSSTLGMGGGTAGRYSVSRDGKRFLFGVGSAATESSPITVVLNWPAALKK